MDATKEVDRIRRYFIAKSLQPAGGLRVPMAQAGVFSARELIGNTVASFVSVAGFDNNGVTCTGARVIFTSDGGVLFDSYLQTSLATKVAYNIGFVFKRSGRGNGWINGFGYSNRDGHRVTEKFGSPWLRDHWHAAVQEGIVFALIATTDLEGSTRELARAWTRLLPVPFQGMYEVDDSEEVNAILAKYREWGSDDFDPFPD